MILWSISWRQTVSKSTKWLSIKDTSCALLWMTGHNVITNKKVSICHHQHFFCSFCRLRSKFSPWKLFNGSFSGPYHFSRQNILLTKFNRNNWTFLKWTRHKKLARTWPSKRKYYKETHPISYLFYAYGVQTQIL
jgi:hypothetical protein